MTNSNVINITIDDGFKELRINNSRSLRWNPSDINFIDKYHVFMEWIDEDLALEIKKLEESSDGTANSYKVGSLTELGDMFNERIDKLFGEGASKAIFDGVNPLSTNSSGFIYLSFIEAIAPILEDSFKVSLEAAEDYKKKANIMKKSRGKR